MEYHKARFLDVLDDARCDAHGSRNTEMPTAAASVKLALAWDSVDMPINAGRFNPVDDTDDYSRPVKHGPVTAFLNAVPFMLYERATTGAPVYSREQCHHCVNSDSTTCFEYLKGDGYLWSCSKSHDVAVSAELTRVPDIFLIPSPNHWRECYVEEFCAARIGAEGMNTVIERLIREEREGTRKIYTGFKMEIMFGAAALLNVDTYNLCARAWPFAAFGIAEDARLFENYDESEGGFVIERKHEYGPWHDGWCPLFLRDLYGGESARTKPHVAAMARAIYDAPELWPVFAVADETTDDEE